MKKALIQNLKLLNEELAKPDAEPTDLFGAYLGGEQRKDVPTPNEKDTRPEKSFIYALSSYIDGEDSDSIEEFTTRLKTLLAQNKYSKYLKPVGTTAFRILFNIDLKNTSKMLGYKPEFLLRNDDLIFDGIGGISVFKDVTSWTTAITPGLITNISAMQGDIEPGKCFVILVAPIEGNNFVLNWKTLSTAPFLPGYVQSNLSIEKDVLGIGPIHYEESWAFVNKTKSNMRSSDIIKQF